MLDAHQDHVEVGEPGVDFGCLGGVDHIKYDLLDLSAELSGLGHRGPVIVSLVEVIPVHLVYSDCEHFLVFGIYSLLDHAVVEQLVDVEAGSMTVVED